VTLEIVVRLATRRALARGRPHVFDVLAHPNPACPYSRINLKRYVFLALVRRPWRRSPFVSVWKETPASLTDRHLEMIEFVYGKSGAADARKARYRAIHDPQLTPEQEVQRELDKALRPIPSCASSPSIRLRSASIASL